MQINIGTSEWWYIPPKSIVLFSRSDWLAQKWLSYWFTSEQPKRTKWLFCSRKHVVEFWAASDLACVVYLTVILRGRAGYELIYITNEVVGRVGYYQLISGKSEKNNCFSKFSSNSLDFFGWNLLKSWHFLYRRRGEKNFFRPPKFQHKKFAISFSLFGQT